MHATSGKMITMKKSFLYAALMMTMIASTGCLWVAIGGAGAAGYAITKDERSAGTVARDARITASVKTRLVADEHIKAFDINVDTYDGVVTLNGHVETEKLKERAIKISKGVDDVNAVKSKLQVLSE